MPAERRFRIAVKDPEWRWQEEAIEGLSRCSKMTLQEAHDVHDYFDSIGKDCRVIPSDDAGNFILPSDDPPVKFPAGSDPSRSVNRWADSTGKEPLEAEVRIDNLNAIEDVIHGRSPAPPPERVDVERLQALYDASMQGKRNSIDGLVRRIERTDDGGCENIPIGHFRNPVDALFYTNSWNAFPALLAELRSLSDENRQLRDQLSRTALELARLVAEGDADRERLIGMLTGSAREGFETGHPSTRPSVNKDVDPRRGRGGTRQGEGDGDVKQFVVCGKDGFIVAGVAIPFCDEHQPILGCASEQQESQTPQTERVDVERLEKKARDGVATKLMSVLTAQMICEACAEIRSLRADRDRLIGMRMSGPMRKPDGLYTMYPTREMIEAELRKEAGT